MKERILRFEQEEVGKNKQEPTRKSKPEDASKAVQNKMKKRQKKPPQVQAKMTSLPTEVKTSARKNNSMLKSVPSSLNTRMKTPKKVTKGTLLKLARPDASSPVRISKFRALLQSWENSSNIDLTSAVANLPGSSRNVDSQSEQSLQNRRKLSPGVCSAIGQKKLETGPLLNLDQ